MRPAPPPYPTAGSVMITGTGMKPYFSARKPLTSNQPSSGERNFETVFVSADSFVTLVCARTAGAPSAKAIEMLKPHRADNGERLRCRVTVEIRILAKIRHGIRR